MSFQFLFCFAAAVIFLIIELSCPCLLSIWFAAGALAAAMAAYCGVTSWWWLIAIFTVVSAAMLAALRPFLRKFISPHITATNADSLIGKEALVIEPIDNLHAQGRVKVSGTEWSARSTTGQPIAPGSRVVIRSIEGVKLIVEPAAVCV